MQPVPPDYDDDPERWRASRRVVQQYGSGDVHGPVAERIVTNRLAPVLDVGCGDGRLHQQLPPRWPWVGLDSSPTMLARAPRPAVRGDATNLPFPDMTLAAVAMLYMLYHVDNPEVALAEAKRVLRPGGLLATCTTSRYDSPELADVWTPEPTPFDAEEAPEIVGRHFDDVEVVAWDAPYVHLPDSVALFDYLVGHLMPRPDAKAACETTATPLDVTKRGVMVFARRLH